MPLYFAFTAMASQVWKWNFVHFLEIRLDYAHKPLYPGGLHQGFTFHLKCKFQELSFLPSLCIDQRPLPVLQGDKFAVVRPRHPL